MPNDTSQSPALEGLGPPTPRLILHITPSKRWDAAGTQDYSAPSLESEGFIHCSTAEQVLLPAHALFRGQQGLALLCIDTLHLSAPLIYEDCYDAGQAFPHVYGHINRDAIIAAVPFPPGPDGQFSLPGEIGDLRASLSRPTP